MPPSTTAGRQPKFCRHCGAALPPNDPLFCVECGGAIYAGMPTVRLPNAPREQSVLGGTIRLPTSGAMLPGLWFHDHLPGVDDVVAVYAPLRAVVGGWSGLTGQGWRRVSERAAPGGTQMIFRFETVREWFAAPERARGLRLGVRLQAESRADEGRERRGFRYRVRRDPPMEVAEAWWFDPISQLRGGEPVPQIQIMAPPRVPRISDYDERIKTMTAPDADAWAREGQIHDVLTLLNPAQQRTPAGRGLELGAIRHRSLLPRLFGWMGDRYRVQLFRPLVIAWDEWQRLQTRIETEARGVGLDLETDAMVEWWLDRQGHDGLVLDGVRQRYNYDRVVIAFRRAQIAQIRD